MIFEVVLGPGHVDGQFRLARAPSISNCNGIVTFVSSPCSRAKCSDTSKFLRDRKSIHGECRSWRTENCGAGRVSASK